MDERFADDVSRFTLITSLMSTVILPTTLHRNHLPRIRPGCLECIVIRARQRRRRDAADRVRYRERHAFVRRQRVRARGRDPVRRCARTVEPCAGRSGMWRLGGRGLQAAEEMNGLLPASLQRAATDCGAVPTVDRWHR